MTAPEMIPQQPEGGRPAPKVGDRVRILEIVSELYTAPEMPSPGIVSDMVAMVGKEFLITKMEMDGKGRLLFEINEWVFLAEWFEVVPSVPSLPEGPDPTPKQVCPGRFHLTDDWVDNNHMPCQDCGVAYGDHPEVPDPEKGRGLDPLPAVADAARLRDAVERFLAARDGLDSIPDGEAGDIEIGRRAELASGLNADLDEAIADMRSALEAKPAGAIAKAEQSPSSVAEAMKKALEMAIEEFAHDVPGSCWSTGPFKGTAEDDMCRGCMVIRAAERALADASRGGV